MKSDYVAGLYPGKWKEVEEYFLHQRGRFTCFSGSSGLGAQKGFPDASVNLDVNIMFNLLNTSIHTRDASSALLHGGEIMVCQVWMCIDRAPYKDR